MKGFVLTESNEPIIGATLRVVNANTGTSTDESGKFEIKLLEGLNRISVSSTGYQTEIFEVVLEKDLARNIFLKIDQKQLNELVVKVKKKDYSYEVIKHVIDNKANILNQYQNFQSKVYIKSVEKVDRKPPKKKPDEEKDDLAEVLEKKPVVKDSIPNLNIYECSLIRHQNAQG
ncbi:MAG: carboxypeptidase-like regulatory domain-containing protein, partial [Leadbetterella sp.]|nr:carboxypeptidase-like regulatory domain-containing protein [Leadbetterella sp.]